MKFRSIRLIVLLAVLVVVVHGCATMKGSFNHAANVNTIAAYEAFLRDYPQGEYADKVRAQLESLYFQRAQQINTIEAFEDFLKRYPKSRYLSQAHANLELLHFQRAKREHTYKAYEDFLRRYPSSKFAGEAQAQLEALLFQNAVQANTVEAYENYLKHYPNGKFARESRAKIAELLAATPNVLYFYFASEGCPYCRAMASVIERFYRDYGINRRDKTPRAFLDRSFIHLAALASGLQLPRLVELPTKERYQVYGVPIAGWGNPEAFKQATGLTFPIVSPPGLSVNTSQHPVVVFHNKQTRVTRVASVGRVSYSDLIGHATSFTRGEALPIIRSPGH